MLQALPEPRVEPAVDTSAGASGVTAHRMDGLAEMQRLTASIGRQAQVLLWMRIVDPQEFTAIARVHAAIDSVAAFYGFGRPAPEVERLDAALAQASRAWRPSPRASGSIHQLRADLRRRLARAYRC